MLVLNRIDQAFATYNYPAKMKRFEYFIQLTEDPRYSVITVIPTFENTDITIDPATNMRLQMGLVDNNFSDIDKFVRTLLATNQNHLTDNNSARLLVLTQLEPAMGHQGTRIVANKPIHLFVGRPHAGSGYVTYQQIPPSLEWGKNFVTLPIRNTHQRPITDSSQTNHFFRSVASGPTEATLYQFLLEDIGKDRDEIESRHNIKHLMGWKTGDEFVTNTINNKYFVLKANSTLWTLEAYRGNSNFTHSVVPAVEHSISSQLPDTKLSLEQWRSSWWSQPRTTTPNT